MVSFVAWIFLSISQVFRDQHEKESGGLHIWVHSACSNLTSSLRRWRGVLFVLIMLIPVIAVTANRDKPTNSYENYFNLNQCNHDFTWVENFFWFLSCTLPQGSAGTPISSIEGLDINVNVNSSHLVHITLVELTWPRIPRYEIEMGLGAVYITRE